MGLLDPSSWAYPDSLPSAEPEEFVPFEVPDHVLPAGPAPTHLKNYLYAKSL